MTRLYSLLARAHVWCASAREERGQTFAEYAVIIGIVTVGVVLAVSGLRDAVTTALTNAATAI